MKFNFPFFGFNMNRCFFPKRPQYFSKNFDNHDKSVGAITPKANVGATISKENVVAITSKSAVGATISKENVGAIIDRPFNESNKKKSDTEPDPIIDIFGIQLHYDDILLISLIFFLYSEGVDDSNLFIALILLLLT